ncbi:MAG: hypothetical protein LDL53_00455 [Candidatus Hydrogenedens sp.]|nr:hypothetical protein [Candidatus Hydrogenedens sp.]
MSALTDTFSSTFYRPHRPNPIPVRAFSLVIIPPFFSLDFRIGGDEFSY